MDVNEISKIELPENIKQVISASRSQFFAEQGMVYEKSNQAIILLMKSMIIAIQKLEEENKKLKDRPNRAERRKVEKKKNMS